jgi:hypothetical protein
MTQHRSKLTVAMPIEKAGDKITPPGLPLPAGQQSKLATDDCIEPPRI